MHFIISIVLISRQQRSGRGIGNVDPTVIFSDTIATLLVNIIFPYFIKNMTVFTIIC